MNRILHSAAACLLMLSLAGVANAQSDGKSYSPVFCTKTLSNAAGSYANLPNGFFNQSDDVSMRVSCPIVKDNVLSLTGLDYAVIYVVNPRGSTTTCTIFSLGIDGKTVDSRHAKTSGVGLHALYFFPYPSKSAEDGTYAIECLLPPRAAIRSYTIVENGE